MNKKRRGNKESAEGRKIVMATKEQTSVSEQFRTIRTNIMYSSVDKPIRSVLFTSATPGAGKSTIAANMAIAYAQAGKRTLLLDADLRRPTTHYTFEVMNRIGLSTAIVSDVELVDLVKHTDYDMLDLITSGPIPPNPSELLSSKRLEQFMNTLNIHYEMIIIDSPPLLSVTDAQILSKRADGVVLVTNVENNNRNQLLEAKDLLNRADANIIGLLLNQRDVRSGGKDGYYYYESASEKSWQHNLKHKTP
ncbi:CpsD/CapB family tyrosine-protein kinase [Salinicoccus roseus]|uniref:non-specific protein-tyrosine kinase n=1 Tax=Salinicoccus roseus TaxID=45670 RepID=A0ABT4YF69_9STAP|nr:CpsD/CapB family tyrosine-protein kinase [Salinicoccus roseus]MDB0579473.1 CpsD/CapB family tyrosine-protein kinase [Salinicoccus roseus]